MKAPTKYSTFKKTMGVTDGSSPMLLTDVISGVRKFNTTMKQEKDGTSKKRKQMVDLSNPVELPIVISKLMAHVVGEEATKQYVIVKRQKTEDISEQPTLDDECELEVSPIHSMKTQHRSLSGEIQILKEKQIRFSEELQKINQELEEKEKNKRLLESNINPLVKDLLTNAKKCNLDKAFLMAEIEKMYSTSEEVEAQQTAAIL